MNQTDKVFVKTIRDSRFQKLSEMFIYSNRIAYVNLRLAQEYISKAGKNPEYGEYAQDSLSEAAIYLDRSIKIMLDIRADASRMFPSIKSASIDPADIKTKIMTGVESYVRVEKDWEALRKMADALERTGSEAGEDQETARKDILNVLKDILSSCDKAVSIFRAAQNRILDGLE